jgi:hypothetical protein
MPLRVISKNDSMKTFIKHNITRQNYLEPLENFITFLRSCLPKNRKKQNSIIPMHKVPNIPPIQETLHMWNKKFLEFMKNKMISVITKCLHWGWHKDNIQTETSKARKRTGRFQNVATLL